jgi:hypothetical protein
MMSSLSGNSSSLRPYLSTQYAAAGPSGVQRTAEPPALKADSWDKVSAGKGQVSQSQLASVIVTLSPEGSRLSEAEAKTAAQQLFTRMDSDGDGSVNESEFMAAADKTSGRTNGGGARGPGGPGGPGGHGGPGGPGGPGPSSGPGRTDKSDAGRADGLATADTTLDPADANEDGTVSALERMTYEKQQAASA